MTAKQLIEKYSKQIMVITQLRGKATLARQPQSGENGDDVAARYAEAQAFGLMAQEREQDLLAQIALGEDLVAIPFQATKAAVIAKFLRLSGLRSARA